MDKYLLIFVKADGTTRLLTVDKSLVDGNGGVYVRGLLEPDETSAMICQPPLVGEVYPEPLA
jgi:hypothetical protein